MTKKNLTRRSDDWAERKFKEEMTGRFRVLSEAVNQRRRSSFYFFKKHFLHMLYVLFLLTVTLSRFPIYFYFL